MGLKPPRFERGDPRKRISGVLALNASQSHKVDHCEAGSTPGRDTLSSAALPHIFDRFWRADKVRSRAEGGVGLGLSLAFQIVQSHHGTITVDSILGKGSSFLVKLPTSEPS
jgi:light-regulated signal transduction histidine kinase (bacteriophytochrome)